MAGWKNGEYCEMRKETLTREIIKKEIIKKAVANIISVILFTVVLFGLFSLFVWIFGLLAGFLGIIFRVIRAAILVAFAVQFVAEVITIFRAASDKLCLRVDSVIGLEEHSPLIFFNGIWIMREKASKIHFKNYGEYEDGPYSTHYKWSKLYKMDGKTLFESVNIGDNFLLVSADGRKNLMIYDLNNFEFSRWEGVENTEIL